MKKLLNVSLALLLSAGPGWQQGTPACASEKKSGSETHYAPCMSWVSKTGRTEAVFLCIHGLGLDATTYNTFAQSMTEKGITCYALDVRGFGSWARSAGHEQVDFDSCLEDVRVALNAVRAANKGVPVFLVGESMGGAIALRAASLYPELIDGVISSVPASERFQAGRTDLKVALSFLKGPNKPSSAGASIVDQATHNEALKTEWQCDPLSRFDLSPHELIQFQRFMNENHEAAKKVVSPLLMLQGTQDKLVKPQGSYDLFSRIKCPNKIFISLPSEHLILEIQDTHTKVFDQTVGNLITGWLKAQKSVLESRPPDDSRLVLQVEQTQQTQQIQEQTASAPMPPVALVEPEQSIEASGEADPMEKEMTLALRSMRNSKFQEARKLFEAIVSAEPLNSDAHYWFALCLAHLGDNSRAREEKALAQALMKVNPAPRRNENYVLGSRGAASGATVAVNRQQLTEGKPTVVIFQAPWCVECQGIDGIIKDVYKNYGENLKVLSLDVDDQANEGLVKYFNTGPIPSFVFLNRDGSTSNTVIGRASYATLSRELKKIVSVP